MPRRAQRVAAGGVAFLLVVLAALGSARASVIVPHLPAGGDPRDFAAASAAYEGANTAFLAGDAVEALRLVEEAWRLNPNASTALILAVVLERLRRHRDAFVACLTGLALDPRPEEEAALRRRVIAHGERMQPPYGLLEISPTPPFDRLIVDGRPVPPGRLLGVSAGEHMVRGERVGHEPWESQFVARPGATVRLSGVLVIRAAAPSAPDRQLPMALIIGGGLATVAGAVMHAVAAGHADDAARYAEPGSARSTAEGRERYREARDAGEAAEIGAWIGLGAGAAMIIGGTIAWALGDADGPGVTPRVTPDGAGVAAGFRF